MKEFDELLDEVLYNTIAQVFGESASKLIYKMAERIPSLKQEKMADRTELFYDYLEKLLGSEGMIVIKSTVLKKLFLKLRREYEEVEKYFLFLDELYEIKFQLLDSSWKESIYS